jgi:hypothetical protein
VIDTEKRPVLTGLVALAAVALIIGVLGGLAMLVGVKALGLDGGSVSESGGESSGGELYLPEPTDTSSAPASGRATGQGAGASPKPKKPAAAITLSAGQASVSPMQQIDLTGSYPTGEGSILQVQRLENGAWSDFPVTMSVSGQRFSTYVQTSRPGPNKFRVIDTDTRVISNPVTISVG